MKEQEILELINERKGIRLDIGCGHVKHSGFIGMDKQELPPVDIVHDWEVYPWPLPDECVTVAIVSNVIEHIDPSNGGFIRWMDELWRVCKPGAEVAIVHPHGSSQYYLQDPTHCNPRNQDTWWYFDPESILYLQYRPRPWHVKERFWSPASNVEIALVKLTMDQIPKVEIDYSEEDRA